jgi:hypothetical protein
MKPEHLAFVILLVIISSASADFWQASIGTNSSHWSINRQSGNLTFIQSSLVEGKIVPVEFHGVLLNPYSSYYSEIIANDVRLRERTSALEGDYRSAEETRLWSNIEDEIDINYVKPPETNVFTFSFYEKWPVSLTSRRTLEYSGRQINDRDFEGNNLDFVGSNLLYNSKLFKDRSAVMWLASMNATVQATDDSILGAEFMPTKYLGYQIQTNTTGIADFRYRQAGSKYNVKRYDYPPLSESDERYYGTYDLTRKIEMRSQYPYYNGMDNETDGETYGETEWLPCCSWDDLSLDDQHGRSIDMVFNCSCKPLETRDEVLNQKS